MSITALEETFSLQTVRVLRATPLLLQAALAYDAFLKHWEQCDLCQPSTGAMAGDDDRCDAGEALLATANDRNRRALAVAIGERTAWD